jgi:RNA polymerase sigma-70 factor (ECF subfamily)
MSKNVDLQMILEGCRVNNPKSQKLLYSHFFGYSMNICLRFSNCKKAAEEILNDAFLKVFQNINKYKNELPFRPWLRRIIINSAIDYHRIHHNYIKYISLKDMTDIVSDEIAIIPPSEDILPIIQQLPPGYRMVFNLYVMEEYKHREIAEKLSITPGTSKSNLARAKAKLQSLLVSSGKIKSKYA